MGFRLYHRALIEENKWRAARWGIGGKLIDFGRQVEVPMGRPRPSNCSPSSMMLSTNSAAAKRYEPIRRILEHGTSADRQLRVYEQTGDLKQVVRHIVAETQEGLPQRASRRQQGINFYEVAARTTGSEK